MLESQNEILGLRNKVKELEGQSGAEQSAASKEVVKKKNPQRLEIFRMQPIKINPEIEAKILKEKEQKQE
jgi:hypothetical protein